MKSNKGTPRFIVKEKVEKENIKVLTNINQDLQISFKGKIEKKNIGKKQTVWRRVGTILTKR